VTRVLIETRPSLDPELAALVAAQQRETGQIGGRFGSPSGRGPAFTPDDDSAYLVAAVGGRAVACASWRPLTDGVAELRRMYVRPSFRGRGIARQLIVAVEEDALAAGRPVIRLETGRTLAAPLALYRSAGYTPIPAYGEYAGNPYSVCFEKRLAALVQ
jgi:GNAT superfamily N-acetyltransferase